MPNLYLKDGFWWINYRIKGKRYRDSTGTRDKKLAEIKLKNIELSLFKGELGAKSTLSNKMPFRDFISRYREYMLSNSPVDKHSDLARLRIIQDFLARKGVRYPSEISPNLVDELRTTVLSGKSPKTVKNYIMLLKTALNKAVEWDILDHNPIAKVKTPKIVKTFNFFTKDEIDKLIANADEQLKTAIIILVNTGMRRGELFYLRWRDINLENKRLRVWPYEGFSPKGKRPRSIPFTPEVIQIIDKLVKRKKYGEYVFRPFNGPNTLYRHFSALTKRLKIKGTLHDLRHTFASHLAMSGVPIPIIKELLGHSDISTTMIYSHLSPDVHTAAIQKLKF